MPAAGTHGPADRLRGLVAGQQDQRAAAMGVVEGPLQRREVATEHVAEPVDHADPVPDQVGAMGYQQPQLGDQRGGDFDLGQIAAVSQRLGDDIGVTGIGLGLTAVGAGHLVHRSTGDVPDALTVRRQQREKQPGHGPGDVDSPDHFLGAGKHAADRVEDGGLVVDHLRRPDRRAARVDQTDPVMSLADIDARPAERDPLPHLLLLRAHEQCRGPKDTPPTDP
jgi:hypothetical protein